MGHAQMCLACLVLIQTLSCVVPALPDNLGLTEDEMETVKEVLKLYEQTISYKFNLHEILKPFLTAAFRARAQGAAATQQAAALVLQPLSLLGDAARLRAWLASARARKPLRAGAAQNATKELIDLLKMALEKKFTPKMEGTMKNAAARLFSSYYSA